MPVIGYELGMAKFADEVFRVKDYLRAAILRAELAEGTPIYEAMLRTETGASTRAIKQALIDLAREGLLWRKRHLGTRVAARLPTVICSTLPFVRSIGVLSAYPEAKAAESKYLSRTISGISSALHPPAAMTTFFNVRGRQWSLDDLPHLDVDLIKRTVQGLICVEANNSLELNNLVRAGIPVVSVDYYTADCLFDVLAVDHIEAGYNTTSYLLEIGHRRVAFVGEAQSHRSSDPTWQDRLTGYLRAIANRGGAAPRPLILDSGRSPVRTPEQLAEFHRAYQPTAYVVSSGLQAEPLMLMLSEMGLPCPAKISIACADNSVDLACERNLSRFIVDYDKLGMNSVRVLASRLACRPMPPVRVILHGRFSAGTTALPLDSD